MKPFEKFLERTNEDKELFEKYRMMRETLQTYDIHEWQLEKGYRIPGTVYQNRAETIAEKNRVAEVLKKYGLLTTPEELQEFNNYVVKKFYEIDQETPLQKGKPDYLDDEED